MLGKLSGRHHRPSPAMAIALIALFVAMGGTGYAALKVANGSIGTKQLKNNAVTGAKVKNGSLAAADFGGDLPAGTPGTPGAKGDKGDTGGKGDKGDAGTKGDTGTGSPGTPGLNGAALVAAARCSGCSVSSAHNTANVPLTGTTSWTQAVGDADQVDIKIIWQPATTPCTPATGIGGSQVTVKDGTNTVASFPVPASPPGSPAQPLERSVHLFPPNATSHALTVEVGDNCTGGEGGATVTDVKIDVEKFVP
jgi:hypothetical protein